MKEVIYTASEKMWFSNFLVHKALVHSRQTLIIYGVIFICSIAVFITDNSVVASFELFTSLVLGIYVCIPCKCGRMPIMPAKFRMHVYYPPSYRARGYLIMALAIIAVTSICEYIRVLDTLLIIAGGIAPILIGVFNKFECEKLAKFYKEKNGCECLKPEDFDNLIKFYQKIGDYEEADNLSRRQLKMSIDIASCPAVE